MPFGGMRVDARVRREEGASRAAKAGVRRTSGSIRNISTANSCPFRIPCKLLRINHARKEKEIGFALSCEYIKILALGFVFVLTAVM